MKSIRLGIDLGNVIIDHIAFGTTRQYVQHGGYLEIPPVEGALESLVKFLRQGNVERVAIIYNATDVADQKIFGWFMHWLPQEVINSPKFTFLRSMGGRDKTCDCKRLKITHFIDDRVEVLNRLHGTVPHLFLINANVEEKVQHTAGSNSFCEVRGWDELTCLILAPGLSRR